MSSIVPHRKINLTARDTMLYRKVIVYHQEQHEPNDRGYISIKILENTQAVCSFCQVVDFQTSFYNRSSHHIQTAISSEREGRP